MDGCPGAGTADRAACPPGLRDDWEKTGVMQGCKEQRCEAVGLVGHVHLLSSTDSPIGQEKIHHASQQHLATI